MPAPDHALALPAALTHHEARACLQALRQGLRPAGAAAGPVVIDASALQRFDSSALAVLLECRRSALAAGRALAVQGLPPGLASLAQLYGVDGLLPAP
ncbi:STAS domain-containing protein [Melaminivora sp.]|uniref:STAS domain-containing protein n=1 Tax=Melaminivora sp. TaxID=1933032 RepID=UPI0028A5F03D|nr:STAS domain-containing protein [Melaminivora sp.]